SAVPRSMWSCVLGRTGRRCAWCYLHQLRNEFRCGIAAGWLDDTDPSPAALGGAARDFRGTVRTLSSILAPSRRAVRVSSNELTMTQRIDLPSDASGAERQRLLPDALRLGPVRLRVSDLRRSLDYYTQVLGLEARDVTATN